MAAVGALRGFGIDRRTVQLVGADEVAPALVAITGQPLPDWVAMRSVAGDHPRRVHS